MLCLPGGVSQTSLLRPPPSQPQGLSESPRIWGCCWGLGAAMPGQAAACLPGPKRTQNSRSHFRSRQLPWPRCSHFQDVPKTRRDSP